MNQYEQEGRLTAISDQELEAKAKEFYPDYWQKYSTISSPFYLKPQNH
jgi:hypothetical protein